MRLKFVFLNFVGLFFLTSFFGKSSLACGGMTFPGSYLCGSSSNAAYSLGYPSLTASLVYVPTSLLGGYSQPISYPPNPLATTSTSTNTGYPYSYSYPTSYGYPYSYPSTYSYPSAYSYPSYGYNYPSYGLSSGGLLSGLGGLGSCGTSGLLPSYGLSSFGVGGLGGLGGIGGLGGYGYGSYPSYGAGTVNTLPVYSYPTSSASPVVVVVSPVNNHGCSTNGVSGGIPVYSVPRPVCSQFCGAARYLMRPISRGHSLDSNRLY